MIKYIILFPVILLLSCNDNPSSANSGRISSAEILYFSLRDGVRYIILTDKDGSNEVAITNTKDNLGNILAFSQKNEKITFSSYMENSMSRSLYEYDIEKNTRTKITNDDGNDESAVISHDDSKIVFVSNRNNDHYNIFFLEQATKKIKQITRTENNYYDSQFSPDDSKILFSRYNDGLYHVCTIDSNGSNLTEYGTSKDWNGSPKFSINGDKIYYTSRDIDFGYLFSINIDGTNRTRFSPDPTEVVYSYLISPIDSIIYVSTASDSATENKIFKINTSTLKRTILKESGQSIFLSDCSSDGKSILYSMGFDVFIMDTESKQEINLTHSDFVNSGAVFGNYN